MTKVVKITARFIGGILEWILILLILFSFAIRFSAFQTYLGSQVASYLSKELGREIRIDKIDIVALDRVYFEGLFIEDSHNDTLTSVQTLKIDLGNYPLGFNNIKVQSVTLTDGVVKIIRYAGEEDFNFQYLADYFKSDKPKKKKSSTPLLTVDEIELDGVNFVYELEDKSTNPYGMDYDHLNLKNIKLRATNFSNPDNHLVAQIETLRAKDVSGFELLNFSGQADVSGDSLHVKNMKIKTQKTETR